MDNSNVIKEFLVALGFKVDQNSLNKFDGAITKTTKAAFAFGSAVLATATAATVFVDKVASNLSDLYWASTRIKDGVANIQDFQLSITKFGGSAEGAKQSLENMARFLRTNPGGEGWLNNVGVKTRDGNGELRSSIDLVKQLAALPQPWWLKVKLAGEFGVDEQTLLAIKNGAGQADNAISKLYKNAGINADDASKKSAEFWQRWQQIGATLGVVATVLEVRMLPAMNGLVNIAASAADKLLQLDHETGGFSTKLGLLAAVVWSVNTALRVAFGTSVAKMVAGLIFQVGLLAEALGASEGVVGAITAISAIIEATPIGLIITAVAALAVAAYFVIKNWDKVKSYLSGFFGWLRDKYNIMAKYLGLPAFKEDKGKAPNQQTRSNPRDSKGGYGMPDFQALQKNFGANTVNPNDDDANHTTGQATTKAIVFFQKMGWTADQAAGIVANLLHESSLRTQATGDKGQAFGIAQWHKDRQDAFKTWAGHDIHQSTLDEQLAFVNHELVSGAEKAAGQMLRGAKNAAEAGAIVSRHYERPGIKEEDKAREALSRGKTAQSLIDGSKLQGGSSNKNVTINQKTDIQVSGTDAAGTGRAVAREQNRVNGDLTRNLTGAVT